LAVHKENYGKRISNCGHGYAQLEIYGVFWGGEDNGAKEIIGFASLTGMAAAAPMREWL
jgi:hypothetical protein